MECAYEKPTISARAHLDQSHGADCASARPSATCIRTARRFARAAWTRSRDRGCAGPRARDDRRPARDYR